MIIIRYDAETNPGSLATATRTVELPCPAW
jgi:hypothetical protein